MLGNINLKQILFLDIETVPQEADFDSLNQQMQYLWEKKSTYFRENAQTAGDVYQRAGIYSEFGKIICISVGALTGEPGNYGFKIKSYYGDEEKKVLAEFNSMLINLSKRSEVIFCAHNGKEFDYPYLSRRFLINGIKLPESLCMAGKKPWETKHIDTLELWKFGDYKHYTSLELLTAIFHIPTPKGNLDGSKVAEVYYKEKNYEKIKEYCEGDVVAVAQLLMRYLGLPLISTEVIRRN